MSRNDKPPKTVSFVSQKGGVGKSALARLTAVGAAHRGLRALLADFDLEQLTSVEWNAQRLRNSVEPEIDARAFKSLKKLRKNDSGYDLIVADTRGLADDLSHDIAEASDVVFLPTGASRDDLMPTLALARRLAKRGRGRADRHPCFQRSAAPRSSSPRPSTSSRTAGSSCCEKTGRCATVFRPISISAAPGGKPREPAHLREIAEKAGER